MPSRRRFLAACATGGAVALAGCADPDVAMFVERIADDRAIAERATVDVRPPSHDGTPDREPIPDDTGPMDSDAALVAEAVDGGTEVEGERPPFRPGRPVAYEGVPYAVSWSVVGQRTRTEFRITATVRSADDVTPEIHLDDLSGLDREVLETLPPRRPPDGDEQPDRTGRRLEVQRYYDETEREQSVLVPEPEYDVIDTDAGPLEIETQRVEAERQVYRYEAEALADSLSAFGGQLRSAHEFVLDGLGETEREFFESVVEDGSYYDGESEDGFEGVADRLVAEPAIFVEAREGQWLVAYDGESYWVRVDFVRMVDYADRLERADGPANVPGSSTDR